MQVWLRLLRVGLGAVLRRADTRAVDVSRLRFTVSPGDIDVNLHMNNGRYLTIMDLGRIDILIRTGLWREMRRRRQTAVVAAQRIRYRMALSPWQRFRLDTRLVGWDDDSLVFEHAMITGHRGEGQLAASATARIAVISRRRGGRRSRAGDILSAIGLPRSGPALPDEILAWLAAEKRAARAGVTQAPRTSLP